MITFLRKNSLLVLSAAALMFLFLSRDVTAAADETERGWLETKSAYFTIQYRADVNLKRVVSRINSRGFSVAHNPPSAATLHALNGVEAKMAYRFDMIFARVKEILDMYPSNIHIKVKIFKNRRELNSEYCQLAPFGNTCMSFYIHAYDTIYTSEQDISDSIIAHEMTHALIDHYFAVTPPEKVAEMLAQNVDLHLDD